MTDFEDRDARVVRRWRENNLRAAPPLNITKEEAAYVKMHTQDWKPKPYVHPSVDTIYQDEEDTYPWERDGWDPVAAMSSDYVVPREGTQHEHPVGGGFDTTGGDRDVSSSFDQAPAPAKLDETWPDPSPSDKARITALVAARWSVADMASLLDMSEAQFRWGFHDTLKTAELAMKARLTTSIFADALAASGSARTRVADYLNVFKDQATNLQPQRRQGAKPDQKARPSNGSRKPAGVMPKPDPDGCIPITMTLGDEKMQAVMDAMVQREAREYELINEYRARQERRSVA